VGTGLTDVIALCLAVRPEDRYPDAAGLADDLRRHLADRPLAGVSNRDVAERWRKWRRRRPHAAGALVGFASLLLLAGLGLSYHDRRTDQSLTALADGDLELARGHPAAARRAFRLGLAYLEDLPAADGLRNRLSRGVRDADRTERLGELHATVDRLRGLLGTDAPSAETAAAAEILDRLVRDRRTELFDSVVATDPEPIRRRARADAADLVLLWSHLCVRLAPGDQTSARREAVAVLTETERVLGEHPELAGDRAEYLAALGRSDEARTVRDRIDLSETQSASDFYNLGCRFFRTNTIRSAREAFTRVVELDSRSYWGWYYLGRCHLAGGDALEATVAFGMCTGLDPNQPAGFIQKSVAHSRAGQQDAAVRCLDRALILDPGNATAQTLRREFDRKQRP
jgi:tetratricopeptide (TPR) repeat protein